MFSNYDLKVYNISSVHLQQKQWVIPRTHATTTRHVTQYAHVRAPQKHRWTWLWTAYNARALHECVQSTLIWTKCACPSTYGRWRPKVLSRFGCTQVRCHRTIIPECPVCKVLFYSSLLIPDSVPCCNRVDIHWAHTREPETAAACV